MGLKVTAFTYPQLVNLFEEIFIYQAYAHLKDHTPNLIVDCGSNIGISVLYFKTLYPQCRIIAFEPEPDTFSLLKANVTDNHLAGVTAHCIALSDSDAGQTLYSNPDINGGLTMSLFHSTEKTEFKSVASKRLSSFITSEVDLLKVDVEGSEILIVQDLIDNNKIRLVREMIIEYHPTITNRSVESFVSLIESKNFSCTHEKDFIHPGATEIMIRAKRI